MKIVSMCVAIAAVSAGYCVDGPQKVLLRCGFEKSEDMTEWKSNSDSFSFADGVGEKASRALVWERRKPENNQDAFTSPSFPVECGREYAYSITARSDADIVGRVYVYMCYRVGNRTVSLEGRPLISNRWKKGGKWTVISGATGMVPAGATLGYVRIRVRQNSTGRVVFDNFQVTAGGKRHIVFFQSSAYRDCATEGKVRFVAPYVLEDADCPLKERRPEFIFKGRDGKEAKIPASKVTKDCFFGECDVESFAIGCHPVVARLASSDGREFDRMSMDFTRAAKLPDRKVYFDAHHRLIVDGKPFFPLGMYGCGRNPAETDIYTNSALNCTFVGSPKGMKRASDRGLKVLFSASSLAQKDEKAVKQLVEKIGSQDALLMWCTNDELPPGFVNQQVVLYNRLRKHDPDHPVYTVLDKHFHVHCFMPSLDCIMMDPYPIGNSKRGTISMCTEWPVKAREALYGMRPVMQVPQAFDWQWHRRQYNVTSPEFHFPTREEFRSMIWQPIALGVKGLVWFSFDWMIRESTPEEFKERWGYICEAIAEVARLSPVFLSVEPAPQVKSSNRDVTVRTWVHGGYVWLAVVNTTAKPQTADVSVDGCPRIGSIKVEAGDMPKSAGGRLRFSLPSIGYTFMRWPVRSGN